MPHPHDILTMNSPVTTPNSNPKRVAMQEALPNRSKSPSPTTVARRLSNPPEQEATESYIKTSISHILPGNWPSPITKPMTHDDHPENILVTTKPVQTAAAVYKEKVAALYTTLPKEAQTHLNEATFTKYMYRAIKHNEDLRTLFQKDDIPNVANLQNLKFETYRQQGAGYTAFNIHLKGLETGQFVFEKRQDYKLMGWCQHEPFSFLVAQTAISPHQSPPPSSVCTMDRPIEAKLTTSTHVINFSKGKVCRFQNKNVIG